MTALERNLATLMVVYQIGGKKQEESWGTFLLRKYLKESQCGKGVVQAFDIQGQPKTTQCYAWSHELEGANKRRFFAVLHQGKVDSPEKAVRAAIIDESHR